VREEWKENTSRRIKNAKIQLLNDYENFMFKFESIVTQDGKIAKPDPII